jgi:glucan phosphorylase
MSAAATTTSYRVRPLIVPIDHHAALTAAPLFADDFESYLDAQRMIEEAYLDQESWVKKSIITTASMGKYSSDNAVMKCGSLCS